MHNKYFEILPSKILLYWIISIHVIVLLVILILPVDNLIKLCFVALIGLSYYFSKNKKCLIKSFEYYKNDSWRLYTVQGAQYNTRLLKLNYISDFLLILRFDSMQPLIIFRNQLHPQSWRHLQMIVRN